MFSRYRWQTYILAEAATAIMGPGMATAAMATPTATRWRRVPRTGPGPPRTAGAGDMDEGGDGGPRGHENRGVYVAGGAPGVAGIGGDRQPAPPRPPRTPTATVHGDDRTAATTLLRQAALTGPLQYLCTG